jgi:hypothetical protein
MMTLVFAAIERNNENSVEQAAFKLINDKAH